MSAFMHTGPSSPTPGVPPNRNDPRERKLAGMFVAEPELILACLENLEESGGREAATILKAAERAMAERPRYADLKYYAAQAALHLKQPERALELLEEALQINPDYNAAMILAARACLVMNDQESALEYLRRALVNGADYADVHLMLGDLWAQRDEHSAAQAAYRRALEINADLAPARDGLAKLTLRRGMGGRDELPA